MHEIDFDKEQRRVEAQLQELGEIIESYGREYSPAFSKDSAATSALAECILDWHHRELMVEQQRSSMNVVIDRLQMILKRQTANHDVYPIVAGKRRA